MTGVAAAAAALLLSSGIAAQASTSSAGAPVFRTAPRSAPATSSANGSCTAPGTSYPATPTKDEKLVWVDGSPTTMTAVWLPGLNATHCVARRTVSNAALAAKVAKAIERAKAMPDEPLPCPFSDNTSVRLYFGYADGSDEYADVALNGCRPISAPGRASVWGNTTQFEKTLLPAAPPAWRSYLGGGSAGQVAQGQLAQGAHRGRPVSAPAPGTAPLTRKRHGACTVEPTSQPAPVGANGLVYVDPKPRRVVAIWLPSENASNCMAVRTNDNTLPATRIAAAVEGAPAMPRGIFCPRDDGSAVRLYLTYDSGVDEYVNVELSGCHTVSAPGRMARETTPALTTALRKIAPPGWGNYLKN
jgi:hypothetical protein